MPVTSLAKNPDWEKVPVSAPPLAPSAAEVLEKKTQSALQNALNAHISNKTLVNEIRQIMLRNKDSIIQGMVAGGSDVFTSEQTFEQDIYRMLNTVNL